MENAKVENYKSYRRDGLWDLGAITNGVFKNIYSESTSEIFEPSWLFLAARFLEPLSNCVFEDVIIKDLSKKAEVYPLDFAEGNNVTMKNVHIYVNELSAEGLGPFGISGSNNTILNSSLTIKRHTAKKTYRPVVFHDEETKEFKGKNNYYDIVINGWRDASSDIDKLSPRLIFQDKTNPNSSFARVTDVRNKLLIEQRDYKKTISKL